MKIAINGICGRMGEAVERLAREQEIEVVQGIDAAGAPNQTPSGTPVTQKLESKVDVLIDFSVPEALMARLEECLSLQVPIIICTTGVSPDHVNRIHEASKSIPVLFSSNMSIGMNLLFKTVPEIATKLGEGFDLDVVETHHRFKKDAPSGTAKTLASRIESATGRTVNVASIRSGDVAGEHRVIFGALGESIEITHRAGTRDIFARGALRAAEFLIGAKPGSYSMLDVIS